MTIRTLAIVVTIILIVVFAGGFLAWLFIQPPDEPMVQEKTATPVPATKLLRGPFDVPTNHEPEEHTD